MKNPYLLLFIFVISLSACKEEKSKVVVDQNNKKVIHYICDNKCENSGSDLAGNCPTCKNPYTHNTAFHANDLLKSGPLKVESNATQPTKQIGTAPNQPSPTRNTAGVYHYTCNNGCNGGSGSAAKCTSCGETLAHNQTYHN